MSVDPNELLALPVGEKLRLVELLWDNLGDTTEPIPLPNWVMHEAARRRDELIADPSIGVQHDEIWRRIDGQKG